MSYILARSVRTVLVLPAFAARARPHVSLYALTTSTMHDYDPELLESEKRRNLSGLQYKSSSPIPSAPGWNEYLASLSEAVVKADRDPTTLEELQRLTLQFIRNRYPSKNLEDSYEGMIETSYEPEQMRGHFVRHA